MPIPDRYSGAHTQTHSAHLLAPRDAPTAALVPLSPLRGQTLPSQPALSWGGRRGPSELSRSQTGQERADACRRPSLATPAGCSPQKLSVRPQGCAPATPPPPPLHVPPSSLPGLGQLLPLPRELMDSRHRPCIPHSPTSCVLTHGFGRSPIITHVPYQGTSPHRHRDMCTGDWAFTGRLTQKGLVPFSTPSFMTVAENSEQDGGSPAGRPCKLCFPEHLLKYFPTM